MRKKSYEGNKSDDTQTRGDRRLDRYMQNVDQDRHGEHRAPAAEQAEHEAHKECEKNSKCCHALPAEAEYAAGNKAIRFRFTPIFIRKWLKVRP